MDTSIIAGKLEVGPEGVHITEVPLYMYWAVNAVKKFPQFVRVGPIILHVVPNSIFKVAFRTGTDRGMSFPSYLGWNYMY